MYLEFVQELMEMNGITVRRLQKPYVIDEAFDLGLRTEIVADVDLPSLFQDNLKHLRRQTIYHYTDEFLCNYTSLFLPDSDELFIAGPMLFEAIGSSRLNEMVIRHNLTPELTETLKSYYCRVPLMMAHNSYESVFNLLGKHLFGEGQFEIIRTNALDLVNWYDFHQNYLRIPEKPFLSIQVVEERYAVENEMLSAVLNGNSTKALERNAKLSDMATFSRLSNALRDQKDLSITLNTLLRKCAEEAGVHPIHIDSMSNQNIKLVEQCISMEQLRSARERIIIGYCRLIRQYSLKNYSLLVQKVITYIDTDICADLSLKSLSEQLSINPNYLSTLFKKEMGMSLTDFVNHRRVKHAQRLLVSTDLPIKSVAQKSGIPDVAYFNRLFKRIIGTTPKVYRESTTYQDFRDFENDNRAASV